MAGRIVGMFWAFKYRIQADFTLIDLHTVESDLCYQKLEAGAAATAISASTSDICCSCVLVFLAYDALP